MKLIGIILIALTLFLAPSCQKGTDSSDVIKGRIIDASTQEGVSKAFVYLYNIDSSNGLSSEIIQIDQFQTDSNGDFEIDRDSEASYICAIKEPLYYTNCSNPVSINMNNPNLEVSLFPWANISIGIIDANRLDLNVVKIELISPFEGEGSEIIYQFYPDENTHISGNVIGGVERTFFYRIFYTDGTSLERTVKFNPIGGTNPTFYLEF